MARACFRLCNSRDNSSCFCVLQYAVEMEAKLDQLRSLVEAADRDKVELLNQLEEEKRWVVRFYLHNMVYTLTVTIGTTVQSSTAAFLYLYEAHHVSAFG